MSNIELKSKNFSASQKGTGAERKDMSTPGGAPYRADNRQTSSPMASLVPFAKRLQHRANTHWIEHALIGLSDAGHRSLLWQRMRVTIPGFRLAYHRRTIPRYGRAPRQSLPGVIGSDLFTGT
jgi:hypothetical protein